MTAVGDLLLQHQLHQFLGGRGHILEALSEGDDREAHALKVLHHLHSAPAVESDLPDVELLAEPLDKLLDVAVVDDVALRGLEVPLPLPHIVRDVVTPDAEVEVVLWNPEVRQHRKLIVLVLRREHQHEGGDVRGGGQVQTAVADAPLQIVLGGGESAAVPFLHRHPAHRLFYPLVQAKLAKGVLFGGVLLGGFAGRFDLVDAHRDAQGGVCLFPHLGVCPIVRFIRTVDNGIEGRVHFASLQDVLGLLVCLIADGAGVRSSRRDEKVERLHPGVAGALCHNVKQLSVRLGMQLVEHHAVDVEAVLGIRLRRKYLVEAVGGEVNHPLHGCVDFHPLGEGGTHPHHVCGHLEHDGRLLAVCGTAVHLGAFLTVATTKQKSDRRGEFALSHLLGYFDVGGVELPVAVGLQRPKHIADDLFLPVDQFKRLSRPGAFRVAETFYKADRIVCSVLVVVGILGAKLRRFVFFQLTDSRSPPSKKHKNKPPSATFSVTRNRALRLLPLGILLGA